MRPLEKELAEKIRAGTVIPPGATLLLAVSGGADSVAMAALAAALAPAFGWTCVWGHLNHLLRGAESDADERFVRALADEWKTPLACGRASVARLARRRGHSLEQAARAARYRFLEAAAHDAGAAFVLTAHTADDQAETILLRLARGAGLRGLRGILPVRPIRPGSAVTLARPLLAIRRRALRDYLGERRIVFRTDSSNADLRFARNRMRREVLRPWTRKNPRIVERLAQAAAGAQDLFSRVERETSRFLKDVWPEGSFSRIRVRPFSRLPDALGREVLKQGLPGQKEFSCSRKHLEALAAFVRSGRAGSSLAWPGGFWRHEYDEVVWVSGEPSAPPKPLRISENANCLSRTQFFGKLLTCARKEKIFSLAIGK